MNNEQQELLDEVYKNYLKHNDEVDNYWIKKNPEIESRWKPYSQEEFINKCKTDPELSEKWRLKIEERDLSLEERKIHMSKYSNDRIYPDWDEKFLNEKSIPTKLITITYKDKTITYYQEKLKKD